MFGVWREMTDLVDETENPEKVVEYREPITLVKTGKGTYSLVCEDGYSVEIKDGEIIVKKDNLDYPETFEECDAIISGCEKFSLEEQLEALRKVIICRNVWWAIANYKPNWNDKTEIKYIIYNWKGEITDSMQHGRNTILAFPTQEMCKRFKETYKDLLEKCKYLL